MATAANRAARFEQLSPGEPLVTIRDASIAYSTRGRAATLAVDSVSIDIRKGEKFVILGPSGCGKSTLLTAIGGFIPLTSGSIKIDGEPVGSPSMDRIMVFQDFGQLLPWRTVLGNVTWGIRRRFPKMSRSEAQARARECIALVGLDRQSPQYPNTLSGGQKQRCALARAFAVAPALLLMDEPFGALDAINRERMQAELNRMLMEGARGMTVIFVTHDVNEAVHLGDRIMVMSRGPGRVRALIDNPHVGSPLFHADAMPLAAELRELLKDTENTVS
ncbi:MAG: ABC transporter ATP-binding protein [Hyphomicrobium sp.]|nr:ABC transporter ATP-binding protein [Hyphomicrobium sp.]